MPRGVKGSGRAATVKKGAVTKKVPYAKKAKKAGSAAATSADAPAKKARKPYPSADKRIASADAQIERLTKINDSRRVLIERTEATLNTRKIALAKSTASLEKVLSRKERLIATKGKPIKKSKPTLSPEEPKSKRAKSPAKARTTKGKPTNAIAPKRAPEELKAFRVELMAKARAAKKVKKGK